ncbi:MAG: hypothetical protein ACOVMP_06260 [Chthoniobacterales bacterium]
MKSVRLLVIFVCFLGALPSSLVAELPPSAYEQMQKAATDVFRISVLQVLKFETEDPHKTEIRVVADVVKVGRATTKIRAGEIITIRYIVTEHPPMWAGPGEVPVPEQGAEVPAFLTRSGDTTDYTPAAGAMTFSTFR